MNAENLNNLYKEIDKLTIELIDNAAIKGISLSDAISEALFELYVKEDEHEMILLKRRIEIAISDIKNGTFKRSSSSINELEAKKAS